MLNPTKFKDYSLTFPTSGVGLNTPGAIEKVTDLNWAPLEVASAHVTMGQCNRQS